MPSTLVLGIMEAKGDNFVQERIKNVCLIQPPSGHELPQRICRSSDNWLSAHKFFDICSFVASFFVLLFCHLSAQINANRR